ncbi:MAG: hypothetical protein J6C42_04175 [Clostridia bacterium]|nr:hypothetical protein [Clostridia bacterium]
MAILFRTLTELKIGEMEARLTVYGNGKRLRAELEPYVPVSSTVYTSAVQVTFTYGGESVTVSEPAFRKPLNALFDYQGGVQTLTISSAAGITYQGSSAQTHTISWKGDGSIPAPEITLLPYPGFLKGQLSRVAWEVNGVPEGYTACTVGIWLHHTASADIAPVYTRSCLLSPDERTERTFYEHFVDGAAEGHGIYYRIAVALYEDGEESVGNYAAYTEIETPAYVCSGSIIYTLAPHDLRCGTILKNRPFTFRWEFPTQATQVRGVEIAYAVNGTNSWYSLGRFSEPITAYTYTVTQDWDSIAFRVRSYSTRSKYELSYPLYSEWYRIGATNAYVGQNGKAVPAAMVQVGQKTGGAVLYVG